MRVCVCVCRQMRFLKTFRYPVDGNLLHQRLELGIVRGLAIVAVCYYSTLSVMWLGFVKKRTLPPLPVVLNKLTYRVCHRLFSAGNGPWSLHSIELALWTHFVAKELKPELLDSIPCANGSAASVNVSHQNGDVTTTASNSPSEVISRIMYSF